jgi:hypothetical protein
MTQHSGRKETQGEPVVRPVKVADLLASLGCGLQRTDTIVAPGRVDYVEPDSEVDDEACGELSPGFIGKKDRAKVSWKQ